MYAKFLKTKETLRQKLFTFLKRVVLYFSTMHKNKVNLKVNLQNKSSPKDELTKTATFHSPAMKKQKEDFINEIADDF